MGALLYSMKALEASGKPSDAELRLQLAKLPKHLREQVRYGVSLRLRKLGIGGNINGTAGRIARKT
jgi:hypothetical protein